MITDTRREKCERIIIGYFGGFSLGYTYIDISRTSHRLTLDDLTDKAVERILKDQLSNWRSTRRRNAENRAFYQARKPQQIAAE